jgi:hypothetical protein
MDRMGRLNKMNGRDMKDLLMNGRWFLLSVALVPGVWADSLSPPPKLHQPYFLRAQDKVPLDTLACPDDPIQGPRGATLDLAVNIIPPLPGPMELFSGPSLFEDLQKTKASETAYGKFYWHDFNGMDYCHYKDVEGDHWYGWAGHDGKFNWILWRGKRYWWHDAFAGHWLYYYRGSWWRADGQAQNSIQANIDGEYYACDAQGNVLGDMGQDGNGDIVSAPGRYQGDSHHGGHGGHGGHAGHGGQGGQNGGPSSPGSAPGANPVPGPNGGQPPSGSPQGGNSSPGQSGPPPSAPSGN